MRTQIENNRTEVGEIYVRLEGERETSEKTELNGDNGLSYVKG